MAKDGTNRGGARPGAGRPKKALSEKIASGNPGGRALTQIVVPDDIPDLLGISAKIKLSQLREK